MKKTVVCYARVSDPAMQDKPDSVSIDQQLGDMRDLVERNGWSILAEFVDREVYKSSQAPSKGKMVRPSGERADRPQFLAMLEVVKAGDADVVLCWRDDRLVRHPRVAVALEDALDIGDVARGGKPKIEVRDATGAMIDRFTLSIKAAVWREENKRRVERTRMGKIATLNQGYWPGSYVRYGYKTSKGPRGRIIEIEESEAEWVRQIHRWFDAGVAVQEIRRRLIKEEAPQKGKVRWHRWNESVISSILRDEDYSGIATWNFGDGTSISIDIPLIVGRVLWERNQARIERNKRLSSRKTKGIYLLQGLAVCGGCGAAMVIRRSSHGYVGGVKRPLGRVFGYYCGVAVKFPDEEHSRPISRYGPTLDWAVWRRIVDYGIKQPELIRDQVMERQAELQAQGESVDGDIAHAHKKLEEVHLERAFYQRQAARDKITELEFDHRMDETKEARLYWEGELARLLDLRDNQEAVQAGLNYADRLLSQMQAVLPEIDIEPKALRKLRPEKRRAILKQQQEIIRALIDRVVIYPSGLIKVEGLLDGSEAGAFDLANLTTVQVKTHVEFELDCVVGVDDSTALD